MVLVVISFILRERSFQDRFAKNYSSIGFFEGWADLGGFENHGTVVVQLDFRSRKDQGRHRPLSQVGACPAVAIRRRIFTRSGK